MHEQNYTDTLHELDDLSRAFSAHNRKVTAQHLAYLKSQLPRAIKMGNGPEWLKTIRMLERELDA